MARPLRLEAEGAVYHVVARGNERKDVFRDGRDREDYLERVEKYRERFGFRLLAYCLMDNHLHLAIERGPERLSRVMRSLQSSYTQWFNRRHGRAGHLFQGRYKAFLVQKDRYLLALIRYIHLNPVEAGVVKRPQDYRWSSDRFYRSGRGPEWLDLDVALRMFGRGRRAAASRYRRFMGEEIEEPYGSVKDVRRAIKGDEEFAVRALREAGERTTAAAGRTAENVASVVAEACGLNLRDLSTASRRRDHSRARILSAYLARREAGIPVARTARLFQREESTLNHGVLDLENRLAEDPRLRKDLDRLARQLRGE